jgi:hypothetical protein
LTAYAEQKSLQPKGPQLRCGIERISARRNAEIPGVQITQLQVSHPGADDDGLWFIDIPGGAGGVQVGSSTGNCPFVIESDFSDEKYYGSSVDDVVAAVKRLFLKRPPMPLTAGS